MSYSRILKSWQNAVMFTMDNSRKLGRVIPQIFWINGTCLFLFSGISMKLANVMEFKLGAAFCIS